MNHSRWCKFAQVPITPPDDPVMRKLSECSFPLEGGHIGCLLLPLPLSEREYGYILKFLEISKEMFVRRESAVSYYYELLSWLGYFEAAMRAGAAGLLASDLCREAVILRDAVRGELYRIGGVVAKEGE